MPEPDCFIRYRVNAATRNFITSGKSHIAAARRGFRMVLFIASRGNTFVGGTCALPTALLVFMYRAGICIFTTQLIVWMTTFSE